MCRVDLARFKHTRALLLLHNGALRNGTVVAVAIGSVGMSTRPDPPARLSDAAEIATRGAYLGLVYGYIISGTYHTYE